MANNEVRIKLSADGSQVRQELKLIDKTIQELGSDQPVKKPSKGSKTSDRPISEAEKQSGSAKLEQEARDKGIKQVTRETEKLRKELEKANEQARKNSGGGGSTPPPSSGSGSGSSGLPKMPSGGGSGDSSAGSAIAQIAKVLGTVTTIATIAKNVVSTAKNWQRESQSGQKLAFQSYGSTLWYDDFGKARQSAYDNGSPYGYSADESMQASNAYLNRAGVTGSTLEEQQQNHKTDMNAILRTSKAWGIDEGYMANTTGYMASIGVTNGGDAQKFANILSQSIVDAQMTGREDEQLQVLEEIADTLSGRASTVSGDNLTGMLNMYNALVDQNENLKGSRGGNIVSTAAEVAASGDQSLDILAGFGTQYTGLSGKLELRRLSENDPEQYWKQVYQNYTQMYGTDNLDPLINKMSKSLGSVTKADDLIASWQALNNGGYDASQTDEGELATSERVNNYLDSSLAGSEKMDNAWDNTKQNVGDVVTAVKGGIGNWYSNLSPGWQTAVGVGSTALGGIGVPALIGKGITWAGKTAKAAGNVVPESFGSFVDDITTAYNSAGEINIDDVLAPLAKNGTIGDDVYNAADSVVEALNTGAENSDDVIRAFYKQYGKNWESATGNHTSWLSKFTQAAGESKPGKALKDFFGSSDDAAAAAAGSADDVASAAAGSVDDVVGAAAGSVDDVVAGAGKATGIMGKLGKYAPQIAKAGKIAGVVGTGIQVLTTGIDIKKALDQDDTRTAASEAGGLGGSLAGGFAGAKAGAALGTMIAPGVGTAVGGIIGGVGGSLLGDKLGSMGAGAVHDVASGTPVFTDEQQAQIREYYDTVKELYETKGNNAAQEYTKNTVTPYLNSIGVSTSTTDAYKWDIGKPDFMEDVEKGTFGDIDTSELSDSMSYNTSELDKNTAALSDLTKAYTDASSGKASSSATSGTTSSRTGSWFSRFGAGRAKSHAVGAPYIPYDNYLASLHRGEMVLNKFDADQYRQGITTALTANSNGGGSMSIDLNININGSVAGMSAENQKQITDAVVAQIKGSNIQSMISNGFTRVQNQ
nr:MAG TPA: bacteriocin [Herelleviridae sp.]